MESDISLETAAEILATMTDKYHKTMPRMRDVGNVYNENALLLQIEVGKLENALLTE